MAKGKDKKKTTTAAEPPSDIRRLWKRTKELPCPLNDTELLAAGDELARIIREIAVEEERQKGMRESQKAKITQLEGKKIRTRDDDLSEGGGARRRDRSDPRL